MKLQWIRRYVSLWSVAVTACMVYLLFFNDNSVKTSMEYATQVRQLKREIAACEDTLRLYDELNRRLDTDPTELEKIVREHYHMQRPSEDVYVFE